MTAALPGAAGSGEEKQNAAQDRPSRRGGECERVGGRLEPVTLVGTLEVLVTIDSVCLVVDDDQPCAVIEAEVDEPLEQPPADRRG